MLYTGILVIVLGLVFIVVSIIDVVSKLKVDKSKGMLIVSIIGLVLDLAVIVIGVVIMVTAIQNGDTEFSATKMIPLLIAGVPLVGFTIYNRFKKQ